jgi:Zn-dependent protease with chaperone function
MLFRRAPLYAFCLTAALALSPISTSAAALSTMSADPLGAHVRGLTPQMKALIEQGRRRSATFKALIETLNKSDVVVYLEQTKALPNGLDGRLMFLTSAGGVRYLHAQLTTALNHDELIAVTAHELQHAVEVALHPEVRNSPTLAALYERIGVRTAVKDRYDTAAAQTTGRRVRSELS